ncbi:MAG TPA: NBR1-Ig-like domain-containing protein [Myxococcaceae bacterium]|nr:NBR1-Ig-like domain-containing protein [Myxococcaceae bacterium]
MKRLLGLLCAALMVTGLSACGVEGEEQMPVEESSEEPRLHSDRGGIGLLEQERMVTAFAPPIDPRRTLAVTERAILLNFPVQDVFTQLAAQGGGYTGNQLFRQLWDTQNPAPGQADLHAVTNYAHCTDNANTLNSFPYACRTSEGAEAASTTSQATYEAVGLYNRFDLAPTNGSNCGEYRIVYAKRSGGGRNLIIFEAVLPNPNPSLGIEGCRPIANFWRDLTDDTVVSSRASKLRAFYFEGRATPGGVLLSSTPVVHINNYGVRATDTGQVRTNQFRGGPWMLREFKLQRTCVTSCVTKFVPVTVKTNPFGELFNPASTHPQASQFQSHFITQVPTLAINNVNTFNYTVPDSFNSGQSDAQSFSVPDNYVLQFGTAASTFRTGIQNKLTSIGSTLTPDQIVARAQAQSCGGCHQRSGGAALGGGITFPSPAGSFVHSTEILEPGPEGDRFQISSALTGTFLPHRQGVLANYLDTPVRNAVFLSQAVPGRVAMGSTFNVTIQIRNTGTHAWTAGRNFRLGSQSAQDNTRWGTNRILLAAGETIHQGQTKAFTATLTAPTVPGSYLFQWRMIQENVAWFGASTPLSSITVYDPATSDPCNCPSGSNCPDVECPLPQ